MADGRMQIERTVRLMPVQEHRHRDNGDVGQHQGDDHVPPPPQIEDAGERHDARYR